MVQACDPKAAAGVTGMLGTLMEFDEETNRWCVELIDKKGSTKVKPRSLRRLYSLPGERHDGTGVLCYQCGRRFDLIDTRTRYMWLFEGWRSSSQGLALGS